jgi:hypothetical protein
MGQVHAAHVVASKVHEPCQTIFSKREVVCESPKSYLLRSASTTVAFFYARVDRSGSLGAAEERRLIS